MSRFVYPDWQLPQEPPGPPRPVRVDPDTEFLNALGAENAMSDFIASRQAALYSGGDPLFAKQGKAALDAAPAVLERLGRLRDQVVSQAPSSRRRDLQERLDLHLDDAREDIDRHLAQQRKAWHRQTAEKRLATNRAEATLSFDDFDKLMILAGVNEDAAREVAKASGVDPGSDAERNLVTQARSQTYRAAVEGALQRAGRQAGIALYDKVKNALSPEDRDELGRHIDDQRRRQAAQDYVDRILPAMPATLAEAEAAYVTATAQNDTEFAPDPVQRATNRHAIDVRFGNHRRGLQQAKAELAQAVEDWVSQPAADGQPQTERPPSPIWVRLSPEEQEEVDRRLKLNAFGDAAPARGIAPNIEPVPGSPEYRAAEAAIPESDGTDSTEAASAAAALGVERASGSLTARAGQVLGRLADTAVPLVAAARPAAMAAVPLLVIPTNTQANTFDLGGGLRVRIPPGQDKAIIERRAHGGLLGSDIGARWEALPIEARTGTAPDGRFGVLVDPQQLQNVVGPQTAQQLFGATGVAMAVRPGGPVAAPPLEAEPQARPFRIEARIGKISGKDVPMSFHELSDEEVTKACPGLPMLQGIAMQASMQARAKGLPNGMGYGRFVHAEAEAKVKMEEVRQLLEAAGIHHIQPEVAILNGIKYSYRPRGALVIDVMELNDRNNICIYDYKTGASPFRDAKMESYGRAVAEFALKEKILHASIYVVPIRVP